MKIKFRTFVFFYLLKDDVSPRTNRSFRPPMRAQRSGSHGERRSVAVSELLAFAGSEGYGGSDADAASQPEQEAEGLFELSP